MKKITAKTIRTSNLARASKLAERTRKKEEKKVKVAAKKMFHRNTWEVELGKTVSLQMQDYARKLGFYIKKYGNVYFLSTDPKYITTK